jgi:hypothetical protein
MTRDNNHRDYGEVPPAQELEPGTLVIQDQSIRLGFVQLPKLVLYARNLTRDAKLLYAVLLGYAWQAGSCFPGYARLCYDMGASENTVRVYMRELEQAGLLKQRRRGLGKTNIYILLDLRTAKIEVQEPQNPGTAKTEVLDAAKSEVPEPAKTAGEVETEGIETDRKYSVKSSNGRNSNLFSSNSIAAPLSTTLRRPRTVDNPRWVEPSVDDEPDPAAAPTGWSKLAQVAERLSERRADQRQPSGSAPVPASAGRGRPPKAPPYLAATIEEITHRLNDDPAHVRSNTTRATRLWKYSGLPEDKFVTSVLYQARSLAQQQGNVTKRASAGAGGPINRVPYFFAVVEDLLGLKDSAGDHA